MLKDLFKKVNRGQEPQIDDLNMDYNGFYSGRSERPVDRSADNAEASSASRQAGGYYDAPRTATGARGYEEPDFQSDNARYYDGPAERPVERPIERPVERPAQQAEGGVAPRAVYTEPDVTERAATPVFTPAPAPEYLYFTPTSYSDCRNGIARELADGHVVVVRMHKLEKADMCRLLDFMMGAKVALEAEHVILDGVIVLVPNGVEFDRDELGLYDEDDEDGEYEEDDEDEYEDDDEYEEDDEDDEEYDGEYDDDDEDGDDEYENDREDLSDDTSDDDELDEDAE